MTEKRPPTVVACPRCGKAVPWVPESRWRPFCSERCRKIDLGAWAAGEYRVPVVEEPEQPDTAPGQDG
ncbi:MAG TPA: DNA gyrase inhibitor YacG [Rhodocyclaceae bacterium]